jgi:hypothetical protein
MTRYILSHVQGDGNILYATDRLELAIAGAKDRSSRGRPVAVADRTLWPAGQDGRLGIATDGNYVAISPII